MNSQLDATDYTIVNNCLGREAWSRVLENFEDASVYQTWDYGAVRWGERNLNHMVIRRGGQVVSAAQSRIVRLRPIKKGMAYIFYGPMWRVRGKPRDITNFQVGLKALIDEYIGKSSFILRIRPWGFDGYDADMKSALLGAGFWSSRGIHSLKKRTILIKLEPSEKELKILLEKRWRRNLNRAENEGLQVVEVLDERLWESLKSLYGETLRLKRFKRGINIDEFREIQRRLPLDQKMRVTLCKKGEAFVSAAVCCPIGDIAIGLISASNSSGRESRAFYLLQWDEIIWAKRKGKAFLDLGGTNPLYNPGVHHFKAGIGGREVSLLGVYDKCRNGLFYQAIVGIEFLLRLRDRIL